MAKTVEDLLKKYRVPECERVGIDWDDLDALLNIAESHAPLKSHVSFWRELVTPLDICPECDLLPCQCGED